MRSYGYQGIFDKAITLSVVSTFVLLGFLPIISGVPQSVRLDIATPIQDPIINAVNSTHEIEHIIRQMNESVMSEQVQRLQDFKTRYAYRGDKTAIVASFIYSIFQSNGLETAYDHFIYANYRMKNVVGTKPGISTSDAQVIICAHYDSISNRRWVNAPGANDNGSGIAAVLAAAEILSDYDFNYTIKFIAFCG